MQRLDNRIGLFSALPLAALLAIAFLAPLLVIAAFSVMPQKVFGLGQMPDFSSYAEILRQGYWRSFAWSMGMSVAATVILFIVAWPLAFAMAKVFKKFTLVITIGVVLTLFVS
ncbi:MAG: ABC transporter permease, partial [Pseudomonadota bacterium]